MPYIKQVQAKGREYLYFDTGLTDGRGKRVYRRLPARDDVRNFGSTYSALLAQRTRMEAQTTLATITDLSRAYQLTKKFRAKRPNTQSTYLIYLRRIEAEFGEAPVAHVERKDIQLLMDKMQDQPGAAKMVLLVLRLMFGVALNKGWVSANPTADVEAPESGDDGDHLPWPDDLVTAALADPGVGLPVALLLYTGQRIGDVCQMRWDDIGEDGLLYVRQEKTGKEVWPPIHSGLAAWLERTPRETETILHGPKGRPMRRETLRGQLQKWAAKQGHAVVPHGLRKNAVIELLDADCTLVEVAAITGQSLKIVEEYAKRRDTRAQGRRAMAKWDRGT